LKFDNNRQPLHLFKCSQFNESPGTIRLTAGEFVYKDSMVYLGNSTFAIFPRVSSDTATNNYNKINRFIIVKKEEDVMKKLTETKFEEPISSDGQIYTKAHYGKATHLAFTLKDCRVLTYNMNPSNDNEREW